MNYATWPFEKALSVPALRELQIAVEAHVCTNDHTAAEFANLANILRAFLQHVDPGLVDFDSATHVQAIIDGLDSDPLLA